MDMTLSEYEYLEKKLENPNEKVYCPRCGGEIILETFNTVDYVHCENGCIDETVRGI